MRRSAGFTLIELLIVIGIIGVLIGLLFPVVSNARVSAKKTQCAANLRTIGQAMMAYGTDNDRKVPVFGSDGNFLWNIPKRTRDALVKNGAERRTLYCPMVEGEGDETYWNSDSDTELDKGHTVVGYCFLTKRLPLPPADPASLASDQLASSKFEFTEKDTKKAFKKKLRDSFAQPRASELELVTDMVMSTGSGATTRKFTALGGVNPYNQTTHLTADKKRAEGGNILFMDGRVEWRRWREPPTGTTVTIPDDQMQIRCQPSGSSVDLWF